MIWPTFTSKHLMASIDLHSHSTVSDGSLTPTQLIRFAASKGIRVLALTDHDAVDGLPEARAAAREAGIEVVAGVEISATWKDRTIHIVGLRVDPEHPTLVEGLAAQRSGRVGRAERMAESLAKAGIPGGLEGAYEYATEQVIGRTHFARFLVNRGHAKDMRSVFKKFLVQGKPGYVPHQWTSVENAVAWIRASGGIAVLAHPGRYDLKTGNLNALLDLFVAAGGTAIEVVSGSHTPEMNGRFAYLAKERGLLASRGSDYHGPEQGAYLDLERLPQLPADCVPVWHDWGLAV